MATTPAEMPLWTPSEERRRATQLWAFAEATRPLHGCEPGDYAGLHAWSTREPASFWNTVWDNFGVVGEKGERVRAEPEVMPGARFFPDSRLNFAENLLRRRSDGDAIVFRGEGEAGARWSWDQLRGMVGRLQAAFVALGLKPGDAIAAMLPNAPETVALMLAAAATGIVWSSCSPDFGPRGVLDRFQQVAPKLFIAVDGYFYAGKRVDVAETVRTAAAALGAIPTVILDFAGAGAELAGTIAGAVGFAEFAATFPPREPQFTRLPFSHPLYILFSSGTTGKPKCIVHGAGGTLLQHLKEHRLHCDIRAGDRVFYFTTCGWMMWNWLVSALASDATICLYDGSPFHPDPERLFAYAAEERFTVFGTSARMIDSLRKLDREPGANHDLGALRTVLSTGSPLAAEGFDYVYEKIAPDVHLASISGGTDIVSCFVLGVPTLPVWAGELQGPGLGLAVDVVDEGGQPLLAGKGELVCRRPFPSTPICFLNDAESSRFHAAYFARFPHIWAHGDFAEWTAHGGMIIHGRSDATLNPGGVRIGTAEIYGVVEGFSEIEGALCIGQDWEGDTRIVLFVTLQARATLDAALIARIRAEIRAQTSPRHVPARVLAVADLPRTRSGKLVEIAVRETVHGRKVSNIDSIANPESLKLFENLVELRT